MNAVAIKKGHSHEKAAAFREMGSFRCDHCGEVFSIFQQPSVANNKTAEKQAYWLEKVLAEEHEREKKHPDFIELPDYC